MRGPQPQRSDGGYELRGGAMTRAIQSGIGPSCIALLLSMPVFAAQGPALDLASIRTQAAVIEKQWKARAPDARTYFASIYALLAKSATPPSGEQPPERYRQILRVANDALTKNVAAVADWNRLPLYKAQTDIAMELCTLATPAALRKAYAQASSTYVASLTAAAAAIHTEGQPSLNVSPPEGTPNAVAGMDPAAIKDPKARAAYEASIRANAQLSAAVGERMYLQQRIATLRSVCKQTTNETH